MSSVEAYDAASNTWVKKASMHTPRMDSKAEVVDGKIYVIGNLVNGSQDGSGPMEMYDPQKDQWTQEAAMNVRRINFQTVAADGKIYAIGGSAGNDGGSIAGVLTSVEEYDPATDKWTMKAPMIEKKGRFKQQW